jgi:glycosyltransferase involved in cell wall biosynthesis
MRAPLVSCVIPVYNGERFLGEALASVAGQTFPAIEIIVVDDGSTDGTAAVATSGRFGVRYLAQPNAGPAAARNRGIEAASGALVAFLDADDRWHPEKVERQVRILSEHASAAAVVAHAEMFADDDAPVSSRGRPTETPIPAYLSGTLLARRAAFRQVGLFNPALKHADDTDWFLRARACGAHVGLMPDVLLFRRLHATNMSSTGRSSSFDEYLRLLKTQLDRRRQGADLVAPPSD